MGKVRFSRPVGLRAALPALLTVLAALIIPASASALSFEIANESGRPAEDVYVTVSGESGSFDVPGMVDDEAKKLSEIPGQMLTIDELISGRVFISYGAPVHLGESFSSSTRFDWAELTVTPSSTDVANLTAVDQFAIGMRLDTYNGSGQQLETVGDANSDTIFAALQQIPGGPQATIRNGQGEIIRVLSPLHSAAYPNLGEYVRSMAGKTITLHTAFFGTPFTTSEYTGTFGADGSIALHGTTNPISATPATIELGAAELIEDIYTGGNTPNDVEGAIRRDLLSGFSAGFWGGKYGNDALSFCADPLTTGQGSYCPHGFNQPSFGAARAALSPFPTCEQYAAVINQYSDVYGNPYSDASKKVAVGLDQPVDGGEVTKLRLTILPDSGSEMPATGGNSECGAIPAVPIAAPGAPVSKPAIRAQVGEVDLHLRKPASPRGGKVLIGTISCNGVCGRVTAIARKGKTVVARGATRFKQAKGPLTLKLTGAGKKLLAAGARVKVVVSVTATSAQGRKATARGTLTLVTGRSKAGSSK